jgi:hypothetical protein
VSVNSWHLPRGLRRAAVAVTLVAAVLFAWGATTSVVIDGRVVATTSVEARSWRLAHELYADLQAMAAYDELLALETPAARAVYDRYEPARVELVRLNRKWNGRLDALPGEAFRPAVEHTRNAAYWGAEAVEAKARTLVQTDAALDAEVRTRRAAFAEFLLLAGPSLGEAATLYGVDLIGTDAGPVE